MIAYEGTTRRIKAPSASWIRADGACNDDLWSKCCAYCDPPTPWTCLKSGLIRRAQEPSALFGHLHALPFPCMPEYALVSSTMISSTDRKDSSKMSAHIAEMVDQVKPGRMASQDADEQGHCRKPPRGHAFFSPSSFEKRESSQEPESSAASGKR